MFFFSVARRPHRLFSFPSFSQSLLSLLISLAIFAAISFTIVCPIPYAPPSFLSGSPSFPASPARIFLFLAVALFTATAAAATTTTTLSFVFVSSFTAVVDSKASRFSLLFRFVSVLSLSCLSHTGQQPIASILIQVVQRLPVEGERKEDRTKRDSVKA